MVPSSPYKAAYSDFRPAQIVYVSQGETRLYGEVVQVVIAKQTCWARPLAMVMPMAQLQGKADRDPTSMKALRDADLSGHGYPLALKTDSEDVYDVYYDHDNKFVFRDLRQSSDLICPLAWFQAALDTEAVALIAALHRLEADPKRTLPRPAAHQYLHRFIQQVWQSRSC
jgi:hypothetical protein